MKKKILTPVLKIMKVSTMFIKEKNNLQQGLRREDLGNAYL